MKDILENRISVMSASIDQVGLKPRNKKPCAISLRIQDGRMIISFLICRILLELYAEVTFVFLMWLFLFHFISVGGYQRTKGQPNQGKYETGFHWPEWRASEATINRSRSRRMSDEYQILQYKQGICQFLPTYCTYMHAQSSTYHDLTKEEKVFSSVVLA